MPNSTNLQDTLLSHKPAQICLSSSSDTTESAETNSLTSPVKPIAEEPQNTVATFEFAASDNTELHTACHCGNIEAVRYLKALYTPIAW